MNKKRDRRFETVFVQSDKPLDLRVMVQLLVQKLNRGELINHDKSKIQRTADDVSEYDDDKKH